MLAPTDPVTPGIMPEDLVRLARVHEALFAHLSARLPRLFASIAGCTRRHAVPNAHWRVLYVVWVDDHARSIINDDRRRMFLRYWSNEATVPSFSARCPNDRR